MSSITIVENGTDTVLGIPANQLQGPGIYTITNGAISAFAPLPVTGVTLPGTATPAYILNTLGIYYNVKSYGAVGNGVNDDTLNIIQAISAAKASGGTVFFPPGTYLISAVLDISGGSPGAIGVIGAGWDSQIKLKNGSNCYIFTTNNTYTPGLTIADLYLNCNGANQTAGPSGAIDGRGCVWSRFVHLYIDTPYTNGLLLQNDGTGNPGHHCTVDSCLFINGKNAGTGGSGYALNLANADECHIVNNTFQDNGIGTIAEPHQVFDQSGSNEFVANTWVNGGASVNQISVQGIGTKLVGNDFDGGSGHQIRVTRDLAQIIGNRFQNIGSGAGGSGTAGVYVAPGGVAGTQIIGNTFRPINNGSGVANSAIWLDSSVVLSEIHSNDTRLDHTTGTWNNNPYNIGSAGATNIIGTPNFSIRDFGATGNGTTDDTTAIKNAIAAANLAGGVVFAPPGTYLFSSTLSLLTANVSLIGSGIAATTFTTSTSGIDGIVIGNTQSGGHVQLNNMVLRDFTVNLPNASTGSCVNVTGMGEGGEISNVKAQQGKYGFLLEDIDRCVFKNLEAVNQNTASIVCRQGFNNTWGTASFINCHSVLNTANTIGLQFDADGAQGSPNKFDRVSFINHHFYANPGTAGTVGTKFLVGATATQFIGCLYENTLRHNDIEAEVDAAWFSCSFLNVNFGTTPTTDIWYMNSFCQIDVYSCNLQQSNTVFNGNSGSGKVGLWGINKNGGNLGTIFGGSSYGGKLGVDTVFAGDNSLAIGLNNQQMSFVFTHQLQGGPPLEIKPNSDSTTGIKLENAAGTAILTIDTTNQQIIAAGAISTPVATKTSAYTLTATDSIILANATGGAFTVTLPTAVGHNRRYAIKKTDSSANAVTVGTTSSQTIDGATTKSLPSQFNSIDIVSDGANWQVI